MSGFLSAKDTRFIFLLLVTLCCCWWSVHILSKLKHSTYQDFQDGRHRFLGSKLQPWWHSIALQTAVVTLWVYLHIHCLSYMSDQWGPGSYCLGSAAEVVQPYHGLCSLYTSLPVPEALRIPLSRIHGLGMAPSSATFYSLAAPDWA